MVLIRHLFINRLHEHIVLARIEGPSMAGVVDLSSHAQNPEEPRIFINIRGHMGALIKQLRFAPAAFQRLVSQDFNVQAARIGSIKRIARVVGGRFQKRFDCSVDDFRIDQRAIRTNAHHHIGNGCAGGLIVAVQYVVFASSEGLDAQSLAFFDHEVVVRLQTSSRQRPEMPFSIGARVRQLLPAQFFRQGRAVLCPANACSPFAPG